MLPLGRDGEVLTGVDGEALSLRLDADQVQPVGFAEEQALIPYPQNTFRGYRHLQEYFAFPDKYLFVEVAGLDAVQRLPDELLKQACGIRLCFALRAQPRNSSDPHWIT